MNGDNTPLVRIALFCKCTLQIDFLSDNVIHLWRNSRHHQHVCAYLFFFSFLFLRVFFFLLNISFLTFSFSQEQTK